MRAISIAKFLSLTLWGLFLLVPQTGWSLSEVTREIVDLEYPNDDYRIVVNNTKKIKSKNVIYLYSVQVVSNLDERYSLKDSYEERKFICTKLGYGSPDPIADPILSMNQSGSSVLYLAEEETLTKANSDQTFNALDMVPCQLKDTASAVSVNTQ